MNPSFTQERKFYKTHEIPHQCFFKSGDAENQEYFNFFYTYCDVDHARDISDRCSFTATVYLLNGTLIDWCAKKQSDTYRRSSNTETRVIYTRVLHKNWMRNFFRPVGYPIGLPSKLY